MLGRPKARLADEIWLKNLMKVLISSLQLIINFVAYLNMIHVNLIIWIP